jgi:hypothetical protein
MRVKIKMSQTLLWLSSCCGTFHDSEEVPGCVSFEGPSNFRVGFLFCASSCQVVLGGFVAVDHAPVDDGVQKRGWGDGRRTG